MKTPEDEARLLHRGGRPTLADLMDTLEFSPANGAIELNGARMVLARATFGADLQDELVRRFGEHEAMVLMMRLGYRNGREDAEFIRQEWPNLDVGDAFTAGTRLHMMTGTVRVETLHNDFDFKNDRFSGDFLWHQSVEATEYSRRHGRAFAPVCWAQTGYAAGYASVFFRKLVLYKEVSCAAMGDKSCRVVGKTVDGWGENDPFVRMFLDEVLSTRAESPARRKKADRREEVQSTRSFEELVVAPVRAELEKIARARLNALITGPEGSGCRIAAGWLHTARFAHGKIHRSHATSARLPELLEDVRKAIAATGTAGHTLIIEGIDQLSHDLQLTLIEMIKTFGAGPPNLQVIGLSTQTLHQMHKDGQIRSELLYALSVLPIAMPALAYRRSDLPDLAKGHLARMRPTEEDVTYHLTLDACDALSQGDWPGNLPELRATLMRAAICAQNPPTIDAEDIRVARCDAHLSHATSPAGLDFVALWQALLPYFQNGVGIETLTSRIETQALEHAEGNISGAARLLGLSRAKLDYRLKQNSGA